MSKIFRVEKYSDKQKYYYLFSRKIAKKIDNCFYFLKKKKDGDYTEREWYVGWHDWKFELTYAECGYKEGNGELHISLFGWHSVFKFPWKSKRFPDGDCDAPQWGIAIHDNTFWIYRGGDGNWGGGCKWWTWDLPFFTWKHIRHQVECNLGDDRVKSLVMVDSDRIERQQGNKYIPLKEHPLVNKYHYNYKDSYDGSIVPCTFWVEEREWRRKWFKWCGWKGFKKVNRYIEIEFDGEVGKEKGSWKGGCVGCSYNINTGETPMECIKRMEKERTF